MDKIVIFGNAGSGKSTLAKSLARQKTLSHLDLDSLAWQNTMPPERRALSESFAEILQFTKHNASWVIEGCYADLLRFVVEQASELYFMNPGIEVCVANSRKRAWEPHKYSSKEAQDANLDMLIDWIRDYPTRDDEFSLRAHRQLYDRFAKTKHEINANLTLR